jgi:hypothetical protein
MKEIHTAIGGGRRRRIQRLGQDEPKFLIP